MRLLRAIAVATVLLAAAPALSAPAARSGFAVGAQYDTTHVYVAPEDFDRFVRSLVATFGGATSKQGVFQVTPTASQTMSQLVLTPVGTVSVFGFKTPIPYPFGGERTGYLVSDLDAATLAAKAAGAWTKVQPFPDPIGRDALIEWPGGVAMQLYWHTTTPSYAPLATVPENRVYLTDDCADAFLRDWLRFSHGRVISDVARADGAEIGKPGTALRRIAVESSFGRMTIFITDGALPWPYGRELTGYEVADLPTTLAHSEAAGVEALTPLQTVAGRQSAMLRFPGGYIAEVHAIAR